MVQTAMSVKQLGVLVEQITNISKPWIMRN